LKTYGNDNIPAPNAVYIKAKILPLIEPGVKAPNHLDQQPLFAISSDVILDKSFILLLERYDLPKVFYTII
jgi:hypothetical protein